MNRRRLSAVLIAACLCVMMVIVPIVRAEEEGSFQYEVIDGGAVITGCSAADGEVTIPDTLGGYPVTEIGEKAFYNCVDLTRITIPEGVVAIGDSAFSKCFCLQTAVLPESLTWIGDYAFFDCYVLSLQLPAGITHIGYDAFGACEPLPEIDREEGGDEFEETCPPLPEVDREEDDGIFDDLWDQITGTCPPLPEIDREEDDENGQTPVWGGGPSISFEESTEATDGGVFLVEDGLLVDAQHTRIVIATENFTECAIPETVTVIDQSAFYNCTELEDVYYAGTQEQWEQINIGAENQPLRNAKKHFGQVQTPDIADAAILYQPESVECNSGETVQFRVQTQGQVSSWKWQYRKVYKWFDTTMTGYNTDTLTVVTTGARDGYAYRCVITFADGTVLETEPAELTVKTQITNVQNPNDQTVVIGGKGQFTAAAEGEGIRYQWQYLRPDSEIWFETAMEGCTRPTVYIETTAARDGYQYRCKISDVTGNVVYTEPAVMRVLTVTEQPRETFAVNGSDAIFTVSTSVEGGFTYQWQYRRADNGKWTNTSLSGCNTAVLTVPATRARNGYRYRCVLTGAKSGKIETKEAVLHVGDPLVLESQTVSCSATVGETVTLHMNARNAYTYQWEYTRPGNDTWHKTKMDGATTADLNLQVTAARNGYQYRCVIWGLDGTQIISEPITLTVK